ncbi:MAG: LuxR C-terminal-related transcriptional regulator [Candidatus Longimicrobiales bacterium M2_2A_002]
MTSSDGSPTPLEQGRSAYRDREWANAHALLTRANDDSPLDPEDLELLAVSAFMTGHEAVYEESLERAHRGYLEAGVPEAAARSALWLGLHLAERGEMAQGSGWFGRAGRILDAVGDCVERGYLLLPTGLRSLASGDNEAAARVAEEAIAYAQQFGDRDLLTLAVHMKGRALLRQGRVAEGLALLDEAMVAVSTDDLSPQITGLVYCSVISACRRVYALERAHQWTAALTDWCEAQPDMVAFRGQCRVFRSELMRLQGAWRAALEEADRVEAVAGDAIAGAAHYQQGEVYRLQGELEAAEAAYRRASQAGREPQPGLALLRLAQGDAEAAAGTIRRALGETDDALVRAQLLPAFVEIMLETEDLEAAARGSVELQETADRFRSDALRTMAEQAGGALALVRGQPEEALAPLRAAWRGWRALGAPHDAARARMLLGAACLALGDEDGGVMELQAARSRFEALGAGPDVERIDALIRGRPPRDTHGLTPRELQVLALVATGRTNRAIGEDLYISEKTVARHVSNIFRKLGLASRAAATAFAYEHGLTEPPA